MIEHEFHTAQNEFKPFDMIVHVVSYELSRWKKAHVAHTDSICVTLCEVSILKVCLVVIRKRNLSLYSNFQWRVESNVVKCIHLV